MHAILDVLLMFCVFGTTWELIVVVFGWSREDWKIDLAIAFALMTMAVVLASFR